jgi:cytochrome c peroxidase
MRKKQIVIAVLLCSFCIWIIYACSERKSTTKEVKQLIDEDIAQWQQYLKDTLLPLANTSSSPDTLKNSFLKARLLYKKLEWYTEYFMPATTRFVNGAPLPEIENEENKIFEPQGLQVIEPLLYPSFDTSNRNELIRQVKLLISAAQNYKSYLHDLEFNDSHVFDAVRLQVFRIISLGISGFDVPLAQSSISEAAVSLQSLQSILSAYRFTTQQEEALNKQISKATNYLFSNKSFNDFDRLRFIAEYANPISRTLKDLQVSLHIPFINDARLLRPDAATLFDENVFDVNAYVPDSTYHLTEAKALLGKKLFYDKMLSGNGSRNCASCHEPAKAFTDAIAKSASFTTGFIKRNAPTLLNAALQPALFYDMRVTNLENQVQDVVSNKDEMHGSLDEALHKIKKDDEYVRLFKDAYPQIDQVQLRHLQNALASYIRTLTGLDSRFDLYMRGDYQQLNDEEKLGFNLFIGKAKCGTCHFMPLFNGTIPPAYKKIESEVIGVPKSKAGKAIDEDAGRYAIYQLDPYLNAFKTVTVRNAALTAPYMHNGVYNTLEEVVDFYNKGGGAGLGIDVKNQTLPFDKLDLNKQEQQAIVSFMKSLSDTIKNR